MLKVFIKKIPAFNSAYEFLLPKLLHWVGDEGWAEVKKGNLFSFIKRKVNKNRDLSLVELKYGLPTVPKKSYLKSLFCSFFSKISFIVPCLDDPKSLAFCLQSLRAQSVSSWECVIVVDSSSADFDEVALAFAEADSRFRLVRHFAPSNSAACVNSGLNWVTRDFVCILLPRVVLCTDFVKRSLAHLSSCTCEGIWTVITTSTERSSFIRSCECSEGKDGIVTTMERLTLISRNYLVAQGGLNERADIFSSLNLIIKNGNRAAVEKAAFVGGYTCLDHSKPDNSKSRLTVDGAFTGSDICFICHKDYHAWTSHLICNELPADVVYSFVNIDYRYRNEGAYRYICKNQLPCIGINEYERHNVCPKLLIVFNDWDLKVTRPLVKKAKKKNIYTIGVVEGINDFDDLDTKMWREAYKTVDEVFLSGEHDRNYFSTSSQLTTIGIPRVYSLLEEEVSFPEQDLVIINLNFSYGVLEEFSALWLKDVIQVCSELGLPYLITQHPADRTDVSNCAVSDKDMYTTVREGSLIISRFGSIVLESLCLGKPVVYYNPGIERVKKFTDPLGAYSYAESIYDLKESILMELGRKFSTRQRSMEFLRHHCFSSDLENSSAKVAASRIVELLS